MKIITFCALFIVVRAQFDVLSRYPIVRGYDQIKCLKAFSPKELKAGIVKMSEFLTFVEENLKPNEASNDNYLLSTDIGDNLAYDWAYNKMPFVINSKLSEFPTLCKRFGGMLPTPTTDEGLTKLKKWLGAIGVAANLVLPSVSGE